jgi:hypothetical protein
MLRQETADYVRTEVSQSTGEEACTDQCLVRDVVSSTLESDVHRPGRLNSTEVLRSCRQWGPTKLVLRSVYEMMSTTNLPYSVIIADVFASV